ncbi:hypothetical protein E2I00_006341 [Balaenoptera physalus]|uniref:Uncharacterized protein n=1 Tax=Balaenoptera physalus TaxID=9770 RepID=A0A6A1Q0S7_BALPH|nr:hypothetical protein E2I00_006341 [Balaenoptera physalus]
MHDQMTMINKRKKRTLEESFQMFQIIHQFTTSPEDIFMATKDVIKEFTDDGAYPEEKMLQGMTKKTYVEPVLESIKQSEKENADIDVRYLIAINRRGGPSVAKETDKQDFLEPLLEAEKANLKLPLHLTEIPKQKKLNKSNQIK